MPAKKKSKKPKGSIISDSPAEDGVNGMKAIDTSPPLVVLPEVQRFVTLDMRLLNWNYLNFKLRVKTTTRLFAIKQQIQKRHGPITDLKICKGHFSEANEMRHDMDTLADYGIEGAPENEVEAICLIHYDFKPEQHDNPLLLASEQRG
ncbi:TPA: hypothetical protein N0F65_002043 [Lagenidium giganteum]|uniref:Ubiquitin-like domain-containing protein n=1 Tax=Lagenidium giganteum TaxID=4803 RepID=A0AAV2ZDC4_9STRA|nr:TPA: hypothetical protein N0F65_002043 [Lagenidium giganteum]